MAPRNRKPSNRPLPSNLYWVNASKRHLKYVHPINKKSFGMGSDVKKAIQAAKTLNAQLMESNDLVESVLGNQMSMDTFIDFYYDEIIPAKNYAAKTLTLVNGQKKHLVSHFGKVAVDDVDVRLCDALLDTKPADMANNYRKLMKDIFTHAIAKGYYTRLNPAEMTLKRVSTKSRKRMNIDGFNAIRSVSEQWCQIAMDIALITLQREGDILNFKYDDIENGRWRFITQKTKEPLSIPISPQLQSIIDRSRQDGVVSRYVVHKRHSRSTRGEDFGRINLNSFNIWFRDNRTLAGIYKHLPANEWPSFHEIRALGTKQYRDIGINPQALLGHKNVAMTDHYDSGHDEVRYVEIDQIMDI